MNKIEHVFGLALYLSYAGAHHAEHEKENKIK